MTDKELLTAISDMMDKKLDEKLDSKLEFIKTDISDIKNDISELQSLKTDISNIKNDISELQSLKTDISNIKNDISELQSLKKDISDIKVYQENVIQRNIKVIAESHIDLSRKLDEAMATYREDHLYQIRINLLENEVKELKKEVNDIKSRIA